MALPDRGEEAVGCRGDASTGAGRRRSTSVLGGADLGPLQGIARPAARANCAGWLASNSRATASFSAASTLQVA